MWPSSSGQATGLRMGNKGGKDKGEKGGKGKKGETPPVQAVKKAEKIDISGKNKDKLDDR